MPGNEIVTISLSSTKIISRWDVGKGRVETELGHASVAVSDDGKLIAISVLPHENTPAKDFKSLLVYDREGKHVIAIHSNTGLGPIRFSSQNTIISTSIEFPGIFSQRPCAMEWNLNTQSPSRRFCDSDRDVVILLAVSANRLAAFAGRARHDLEGHVHSITGRISVWDASTGSLLAK
jgi:hypothetical protein